MQEGNNFNRKLLRLHLPPWTQTTTIENSERSGTGLAHWVSMNRAHTIVQLCSHWPVQEPQPMTFHFNFWFYISVNKTWWLFSGPCCYTWQWHARTSIKWQEWVTSGHNLKYTLNPLDYCLWGLLKVRVYSKHFSTIKKEEDFHRITL